MTRMSISVNDSVYSTLESLSGKTRIEKSILIEMSLTGQKSLEDIEIEYLIENIKDEETISYEEVKEELGWK